MSAAEKGRLVRTLIACAIFCTVGAVSDVAQMIAGYMNARLIIVLILLLIGLFASVATLSTRGDWQ